MSAQGATLGRRTVSIPIWPVAVVVLAAATAAVIGLSLDRHDRAGPAGHDRDGRPAARELDRRDP